MSTTLYPRNLASVLGSAGQLALAIARGQASSSLVTNTSTGGVHVPATLTAGGTAVVFYFQVRAFTMSGNVTGNGRGKESVLTANAGLGLLIQRGDSTGAVQSTVLQTTVPGTITEYSTADAAKVLASTAITSTAFSDGDYIIITVELEPAGGTMSNAASETVTNTINGPSGAAGDFSVTFAETIVPGFPSGYPQFRIAPMLVTTGSAGATTLSSPSFTPQTGDIIIVKGNDQDSTGKIGPPTATGITFTKQIDDATASHTYTAIWTGVVNTGGSPITVTVPTVGGSTFKYNFMTEVWDGSTAQLAVTPATCVKTATTTTTTTITTTGTKSVVSFFDADWNPATPGAYVYSAGGIDEGVDFITGVYCCYHAVQQAPTAGSQTIGMTAPTGQQPTILGIEIQAKSGTNYTGTPSDAEGITDAATAVQANAREQDDAEGLTDSASAVQALARSQDEPVGITDSATAATGFVREQDDPLGLTDSATAAQGVARTQDEPLGITDTATAVQAVAREVDDPIGVSDSASAAQVLTRSVSDAVGLTDTAAPVHGVAREQDDAIGLVDTASSVQAVSREQDDAVGITDNVTAILSGSLTPVITDPIGITDTAAPTQANSRSQADAVGITDLASASTDFVRQQDDPIGLTDAASSALAAARVIAEAEGIVDAALSVLASQRAQADAVGLADTVTAVITTAMHYTVTISDAIGLTDSAVAGGIGAIPYPVTPGTSSDPVPVVAGATSPARPTGGATTTISYPVTPA